MTDRLLRAIAVLSVLAAVTSTATACIPPVEAIITGPAYDPHWLHVGYEECFDGSDSWGQGGICYWEWDFGDGSDPDYYEGPPPDCDGDGYEVRHEYSTVGTYYPELYVEDCYDHSDTESFTLYVVDWVLGIEPGYTNKVAVNNDDDNENGTMDKKYPDEQDVEYEDDLVPIVLTVWTDKSGDEALLRVKGSKSCIKIWSDPDKQSLQIPDPHNNNEYYKRWPVAGPLWTMTLYVEGISQSAKDAVELEMDYVAMPPVGPERNVIRDPEAGDALLKFTVLEVDMDMDGVKDDEETHGEITDEIIPGGFVGLDCCVHVELKEVQPDTLTGNVTLDVIAGGSKIEVHDDQGPISLPKTYATPSELPEDICVKGIETSSTLRDITLTLEYPVGPATFEDRINLTVYDVEKVCLSSGNAIASPICYEGGSLRGSPCLPYGAEPSLIIPHCNVRSPSDPSVIRNFTVGADAFLLPALDLADLTELLRDADKWSKVAGPQSGYLDDIKRLDAKYKNPKEGGVYELLFQLPDCGHTMTKSLLHLPLAGPDATNWTLGELAAVLAYGDRLAILEFEFLGHRVPVFKDGIAWLTASIGMDWDDEATQSGHSPCHVWGENETVTISGVVVDDAKFQNMMWGAFTRRVYASDYERVKKAAIFLSHLGLFTPDTPAAIEAYDAGRDLTDGIPISIVMENHGYGMQEPGSLAQELWPSQDPYLGGRVRNDYIDMSTAQLLEAFKQGLGESISDAIKEIWGWF